MATLGLVTALFVGTSVGDTVIDQAPNGVNGFFADSGSANFIADNFISTGGGLLNYEVTFYGGYFPFDPLPADNFTINLYGDTAGLPGGAPALIASGSADTRSATGNILFGVQEYEYSVDLGSLNLAPGTYWIEIFNDTNANDPDNVWFWETGDLDPVSGIVDAAFSLDGIEWFALGGTTELAFTIETTSVIPEPSSFAALAVLGLFAARRRRS